MLLPGSCTTYCGYGRTSLSFPSLLVPFLFLSLYSLLFSFPLSFVPSTHIFTSLTLILVQNLTMTISCAFFITHLLSPPLPSTPTLSPSTLPSHPSSNLPLTLHLPQANLNVTITQADGYGLPLTDDQRRHEEENQRAEAEELQRRNRQERILLLAASYYTAKVTICYQCYYYCYYCYNYHRYNNYCCCCCC